MATVNATTGGSMIGFVADVLMLNTYNLAESVLSSVAWQVFAFTLLLYCRTLITGLWSDDHEHDLQKKSVEAQAEAANKAGSWHNLVIMTDRDAIIDLVQSDPAAIHSRGPVGETILHFLLLLSSPERTEICKELIEMFPDAITDEYQGEPYAGENLLHIAIVNGNVDMVKWLIDREPKLLEARATGSFFKRTGLFYFGEYPLSFAACSNQAHLVEIMLDAGANLIAQDSNGNTVFHMCVWWKRKEMYAFLEDECEKRDLSPDQDPTTITNRLKEAVIHAAGEGLTCLNLAAYLGDLDMFEWLLKRKMVVQWAYGTVTSYLVPLEEIDWKRGKKMGAIEWVVDLAHRDFMKCRHINTLVDRKWERFAAAAFEVRFRKAMFFMLAFSFLTICDRGVYGSWMEMLFIAGLELVLLFGCLHKLVDEIEEIRVEGLNNYLAPRAALENVCSFVPCSAYTMLFLSHHTVQWPVLEHVLRLTTAALGWVYMMYFLLGMKRTGHFVVMIAKMLVRDLVPFSLFTSVFIGMFSMLFFIIFEDDPSPAKFGDHLQNSFDGVIGNMNLDVASLYEADEFGAPPSVVKLAMAKIILVAFVVMCIVLLNLLVAMMGDTYSMISAEAELEWKLQRASTIFSIEQNMSDDELADDKIKYWVDIKGVKYLQIEEEIDGVFDEFQTAESVRRKVEAESVEAKKRERKEKQRAERDAAEARVRAKLGRGDGDGDDVDFDGPGSAGRLRVYLDAKVEVMQQQLTDVVLQECAEIKSAVVDSALRGGGGASPNGWRSPRASMALDTTLQNSFQDALVTHRTAELAAKVDFLQSQVSTLAARNGELEAEVRQRRSGGSGRFAEISRRSVTSMGSRTLPTTPSQSSLLTSPVKSPGE